MPIAGFGTSFATEQSIRDALEAGYRHFDTSLNYMNKDETIQMEIVMGNVFNDVISSGKIKREELFIVSKLEEWDHQRDRVPIAITQSLTNLGLDYLDLYLIHGPESTERKNVSLVETWMGMNDVLESGLTKSIGVSNFDRTQIRSILGTGVVPVTNQVISNPYWTQKPMLAYLQSHNITMTAYSPMGGITDPDLLKDAKLNEIAQFHRVSNAQIAMRYQIQRGVIVIPKANHQKYIVQNLDLFSFNLLDYEMTEIEALNKH
ncbi:aldo-keto reductase AKR2E4-like [Oppia nitens]|uniref:aldo-keto reductase AKR2E4-like n=1 Tax=Oppia nitens TaxID=1686743 RepID=UPI0023DAB2F5|nr:aldo-keto reductase AKR2E4-like [Oppia nitens]